MFINILICAILFVTTFVNADDGNALSTCALCVLNDINPRDELDLDLEFEGISKDSSLTLPSKGQNNYCAVV